MSSTSHENDLNESYAGLDDKTFNSIINHVQKDDQQLPDERLCTVAVEVLAKCLRLSSDNCFVRVQSKAPSQRNRKTTTYIQLPAKGSGCKETTDESSRK